VSKRVWEEEDRKLVFRREVGFGGSKDLG
jgi:hypothetical protein